MRDGALGISTSLQYVPARFAKTDELIELAKVARQYGGIYATHQRSEANAVDASLDEVFEIAVPYEAIKRIAEAKSVSFYLGNREIKFRTEVLDDLREMAARMSG